MKASERTRLHRRIEALIARWKPRLGLSMWRLSVDYDEGEDDLHVATTFAQPSYLSAAMTFRDVPMSQVPDDEFEEVVLHELMHVVLWQLCGNDSSVEEEQVCTLLARTLLNERC